MNIMPFIYRWFASLKVSILFQTCFVDNPLSGLLILVAFFIADWEVAVGTILGGSVATISEMVMSVMI